MRKRRIGVVGGGPAGMMAAITAARYGAEVTLFERNDRVGKKLLATGNGRCNLGNLQLSEKEYYGSRPEWILDCLKRFDTEDTIQFFRGLGLLVKNKNGYLYPACDQAAVVLDVLRNELKELGIQVVTDCMVTAVKCSGKAKERGVEILAGEKRYFFQRVILACGSKAAPKTGSDGNGYRLAAGLGHHLVPQVPALVQLKAAESYMKSVCGVRAEGKIAVIKDGKEAFCERGELQLTEYGISGIPVFQISRMVNYMLLEEKEVTLRVNLLPDYEDGDYERLKAGRRLLAGSRTVEEFFTGMLHKKVMLLFIKMAGLKPFQPMEEADPGKIEKVFALCRSWELHITGSNSYDHAQVCAGGVDTAEVTRNMESKKAPGVYLAGELLDVDGKCGGYNLQWAWCSGYLAGRDAAEKPVE